jgi:hypothetical protein
MKKNTIISALLFLTTYSFGQFSSEFMNITKDGICVNLIDTVTKGWIWNKKMNYHISKFTPTEDGTKELYLPCVHGIKKEDALELFGKPDTIIYEKWRYSTSPPSFKGYSNSYLTIEFEQNRLKKIYETNYKGMLQFISKNWKPIKQGKYYKTTFTAEHQGITIINIPGTEKMDRYLFRNLFGKPNLGLSATAAIMPMQPVTWDDKGNEVRPKPADDKTVTFRYFTSDKKNKFENSLLDVTFSSPSTQLEKIEAVNCSNTVDTFKTIWHFSEELNYYQIKTKNAKDEWTDISLYSKCFCQMDTTMIKEIFGTPSFIKPKENRWYYYTSTGKSLDYRQGLVMQFSDEGKLSGFNWKMVALETRPSH